MLYCNTLLSVGQLSLFMMCAITHYDVCNHRTSCNIFFKFQHKPLAEITSAPSTYCSVKCVEKFGGDLVQGLQNLYAHTLVESVQDRRSTHLQQSGSPVMRTYEVQECTREPWRRNTVMRICDSKKKHEEGHVENWDGTHRFAGAAAKIVEHPATILQTAMVLSNLLKWNPKMQWRMRLLR